MNGKLLINNTGNDIVLNDLIILKNSSIRIELADFNKLKSESNLLKLISNKQIVCYNINLPVCKKDNKINIVKSNTVSKTSITTNNVDFKQNEILSTNTENNQIDNSSSKVKSKSRRGRKSKTKQKANN
jgi:hypothetical protein